MSIHININLDNTKCIQITKQGNQCKNKKSIGEFCKMHYKEPTREDKKYIKCSRKGCDNTIKITSINKECKSCKDETDPEVFYENGKRFTIIELCPIIGCENEAGSCYTHLKYANGIHW